METHFAASPSTKKLGVLTSQLADAVDVDFPTNTRRRVCASPNVRRISQSQKGSSMTAPIKISDMLEKSFHQATHTRSLRAELGNGFAALNPTRQKELVRSLWSVSGIRPDLRNEIANLGDQDAGLRKAWIAYVKKQKGLDDNH